MNRIYRNKKSLLFSIILSISSVFSFSAVISDSDREFIEGLLNLLEKQSYSSGKGRARVQLQGIGEDANSVYTVNFFHKGDMSRTDRFKIDKNGISRDVSWINGKDVSIGCNQSHAAIYAKPPAQYLYRVGYDFSPSTYDRIGNLQLSVFIKRILEGGANISVNHDGDMLRITTENQDDMDFKRTVLLDASKGYRLVSTIKSKNYPRL